MQDSARVPAVTRPVLEQAIADLLVEVATVETFRCVECNRSLPAAMLAFDTDAARGEGVCLTCDGEWPLGIVSAGADDGRYSLIGREVL